MIEKELLRLNHINVWVNMSAPQYRCHDVFCQLCCFNVYILNTHLFNLFQCMVH